MKSKYHTDPVVKNEIDIRLRMMASLFANTGKDSTRKELNDAYRAEWKLMDEIHSIDSEFGKTIRPYNEKEWTSTTKS